MENFEQFRQFMANATCCEAGKQGLLVASKSDLVSKYIDSIGEEEVAMSFEDRYERDFPREIFSDEHLTLNQLFLALRYKYCM